jgi:uncharacterized protein involved in exopolysaccharide biosynthesis
MRSSQPELGHYLAFARRHARALVVCAAVGVVCATGWQLRQPPTYTATASVLLTPVPGYVDTDPAGREPRTVTIDTDAQLVRSAAPVAAVARALGQDPATTLAGLRLSAPSLTEVLEVSYTDGDPRDARLGAAVAARSLINARREYLAALQPGQIGVLQLEVTRRAAELDALAAAGASRTRRETLAEALATLRSRLAGLYAARRTPGEVLQAPRLPDAPDPTDPEVPLTSGLLLGLLAGCGAGALRDAGQRRRADRSASIASTSSPNRSAAAATVSPGSEPAG